MSLVDAEQTYSKYHLGNNIYDTKNLGVIWRKKRDEIGLKFQLKRSKLLKEGYFRSVHLFMIH